VANLKQKVKKEQELGARRAVLEDLFYDFHSSRRQIYWMNFSRGVFFGLGTVIGGTIIVAILIWLLSLFADIPGGFGDFVQYVVDIVQKNEK